MSSPLTASEEKTNGTRLARLLVDGGTSVLRQVLHSNITPGTSLQIWLTNNYPKLQGLKSRRVLFHSQWEKLFPSSGDPPDSNTFDITLLHLLLREICGLSAPSTGWHNMPTDSDTSREANIARIKCFRNELCHSVSTDVPNADFEDKWKKVSKALEDLGLDPMEITRLKNEDIDHDNQRRVEAEVQKWKLDIEPRVETLEQDVQNMKGEICSIQQSISEEANRELTSCLPDEILDVFGRSHEIKQVVEAIEVLKVAAVVITGGPGFGKTTVANKVAHRLFDNGETIVMVCSLRSKTKVIDVANSMILACSNNHSQPPENPEHWLLNWSKQQKQRVTFVLDNADDVLETQDRAYFLRLLSDMRTLSGLHVNFIITSRKTIKDPSLKIREIRLNSLCPEDAKKVILSQVSDRNVLQTFTKTETIVELCGYLPFALCIVSSLLSDYTEEELVERLRDRPLEILREDESDDNSMEKVIQTSFNFLNKDEQKALVVMSVFPGSFNSDAAKALMVPCINSAIQPVSILRSLKNRSLIQQPASHRYEIHPLIQSYAKNLERENYAQLLDQSAELACAHFMSRLANNADMYWSKDKCKESVTLFNEDRPNFEYFLHILFSGLRHQLPKFVRILPETLFEGLFRKCVYLAICLLPSHYEQVLEELLNLCTSSEHVSQRLVLLCLLGHQRRKVGNRAKYKECLKKAIEEYSESATEYYKDKVSEAFFLYNYARFLSEEGKVSEAKKQFTAALKVCEEYLTSDYVQQASALLYAAREDNNRNQRDEAEWKFKKALSIVQENLGNHIMTALLYSNLADFYLFHGGKNLGPKDDRERSITLYNKALEMIDTVGMRDRKVCILSLANLGMCYQLQGNMEEAMRLYLECLNIAERELEDDHRWKIYVKTQMAFWWKKMGNMARAKALKDEAMQMSDRLQLPDNQPPNKFLLKKI